MLRSLIVSAWSRNQRRPSSGTSRFTALEHVECLGDRLVVGGVQPPGPAVLRQQPDHGLEVRLHRGRHVGPLDAEVLEVGGAVDEHLARPVVAVHVVTLPGRTMPAQPAKSRKLSFGFWVNRL
jgi:hypothetical protein